MSNLAYAETPASSEEFFAGAINFITQLESHVDRERNAFPPHEVVLEHLAWSLRADYVISGRVVSLEDSRLEFSVDASYMKIQNEISPESIFELPRFVFPEVSARQCTFICDDIDDFTERFDRFQPNDLATLMAESLAFSSHKVWDETHLILVGWVDQTPPRNTVLSIVPAVISIVIHAYLVPVYCPLSVRDNPIHPSSSEKNLRSGLINANLAKLMENASKSIIEWAEKHSKPDQQILFAEGRTWTPQELAVEVKLGSELGISLQNELIQLGISRAINLNAK